MLGTRTTDSNAMSHSVWRGLEGKEKELIRFPTIDEFWCLTPPHLISCNHNLALQTQTAHGAARGRGRGQRTPQLSSTDTYSEQLLHCTVLYPSANSSTVIYSQLLVVVQDDEMEWNEK